MSQRECAGFIGPPVSIPAAQPVSRVPEAVSRAGSAFRKGVGPLGCLPVMSGSGCGRFAPVPASAAGARPKTAGCFQLHSQTTRPNRALTGTSAQGLLPSLWSRAVGVGQLLTCGDEPQPLPDVRRTDARSRDTDRCEGVTRSFQVRVNKVEPAVPNRRFNLLTKDNRRAALVNEMEPEGPQVPLVSKPRAPACRAERLAGATSGPDGTAVGPAGKAEGMAPDPDTGKEMALGEPGKLVGSDIKNVPFIHNARRDAPGGNQVAEPLRRIRVDFIVPGRHGAAPDH